MDSIDKKDTIGINALIIECIKILSSYKSIDLSIKEIMRIVLDFYEAERSYIFTLNWKDYNATNIYEVCSEGISPEIDNLQNVPLSYFNYWMDSFKAGKTVFIKDINELPSSRQEEFKVLAPQGIVSLMAVPFNVDGRLVSFWGVDNPKRHKKDIGFIETISYFVSNEMQKASFLQQLERISYRDSLTGLYNRNYFQKLSLEYTVNPISNCGIVFADINGLKTINDKYGHESGDRELVFVAETLIGFFPKQTVIRMSGDEFLIVCSNIQKSQLEKIVADLKVAFITDNRDSVSLGYFWTKKLNNLSEGMRRADMLMYISKQEYYHSKEDGYIRKPKHVEKLLRDISKDKYLVYLQPISDLSGNSCYYAEALVRYQDEKTLVYPKTFIGVLEKHYLISDIDMFVFEEVCKSIQSWQEKNPNIRLAVNISQITLLDIDFVEQLEKIRSKYNVEAKKIVLEITETRELINKDAFVAVLEQLQKCGYILALDDFGVGYSSISMLSSTTINIIKLDISITQQIDKNEKSRLIVSTIIDMAHKLGIKCVAEGVETQEQADALISQNCDYLQGFLYNRPLPMDEFFKRYIK